MKIDVMHHLCRAVAIPGNLTTYKAGPEQWGRNNPSPVDRKAIWAELSVMQSNRCAYCEAPIAHPDRHIEHFRKRSTHPTLTFEWTNLFGSCNRNESCGRYKDRQSHDPAHLLKPDQDDPDAFLLFVSDGTVKPRTGLSSADEHRAKETLRVFNLDSDGGALRWQRQMAACGYLQTAEEFAELAAEYPPAEWLPLLERELAAVAHLPFVTAIRHALLPA